jgi:hypothetical protein
MQKKINKIIIKFLLTVFLLVATSFFAASKTEAASLYLSPASSSVSVGNIFSVKVLVNTSGKFINNSDATIQFPTDMIEVISVTKNSSIFSLWVEEPSFSNYTGKITFNGGVPNPGFNGSSGYISTITFKAKKQGTASIIFSDGAVRENDGLGTDILTSKSSSAVQILGVITTTIEKTTPVPDIKDKNITPLKPVIFSETHPNQDLWYSSKTASFSWKIPSGVTSLKTLINNKPDGVPTINYDNSVTQKTLDNLSDGVLYFHLQYFNLTGKSPIAHYRIKIDSVDPLPFTPTIRNDEFKSIIKLDAEDKLSGIDYYTLNIDDDLSIKVNPSDILNGEYKLPILNEGSHNIVVTAYDKANNNTESSLTFISPRIVPPELSLSSSEIIKGETITIAGKTNYPNSNVEINLKENGNSSISDIVKIGSSNKLKTYKETTDENGNFSITTEQIKNNGTISISSEIIFSDKIKSSPSKILYLNVKDTKVVSTTLSLVPPLLSIILVSSLFIIFIIIIYVGWHKFFGLRRKLNHELQNTATEVHKAMLLLKEELRNQLETLEKIKVDRSLNKKEKEIFDEIENNINDIDNFIKKKLGKII